MAFVCFVSQFDRCAFRAKGCEWRWNENEDKSQHEAQCELRTVYCERNCGFSGTSAELERHKPECPVLLEEKRRKREAKKQAYVHMHRKHVEDDAKLVRQAQENRVRLEKAWEVPALGCGDENTTVSSRSCDVEPCVLEKYPDCVLHKHLDEDKSEVKVPFRDQWASETCLEWMMT